MPKTLLGTVPDITVVEEAVDGRQAVGLVRRTAPDVVLTDVRTPMLDGAEATRRIASVSPCRVLILTSVAAVRDGCPPGG
ncbi:response regulator transcription factor [Streptomyces sp. NPDC086519]|uniref:response regulator n=1 Tax=Streptomyces sp. NPDC086519 TaxID=3154863 RepID=UPI003414CC9D